MLINENTTPKYTRLNLPFEHRQQHRARWSTDRKLQVRQVLEISPLDPPCAALLAAALKTGPPSGLGLDRNAHHDDAAHHSIRTFAATAMTTIIGSTYLSRGPCSGLVSTRSDILTNR